MENILKPRANADEKPEPEAVDMGKGNSYNDMSPPTTAVSQYSTKSRSEMSSIQSEIDIIGGRAASILGKHIQSTWNNS